MNMSIFNIHELARIFLFIVKSKGQSSEKQKMDIKLCVKVAADVMLNIRLSKERW